MRGTFCYPLPVRRLEKVRGRSIRDAGACFLGLALVVATLCLTGCGMAVPTERSAYVGKWRGDTMSLSIEHGGTVEYERKQGGVTKSVSAPIQEFIGDDFVVGMFGISTTFKVQVPPTEVDGIWTMVVDGEILIKNFPATAGTLESLESSAADAAKSFVESLDARDYMASWHQLDANAQKNIPLEDWPALLAQSRDPYGAKADRELRGSRYAQTVESGPIGHYFSFFTETSFSNGKRALEQVTTTRDREGSWRVTKYEISRLESKPDSAERTADTAGSSVPNQTTAGPPPGTEETVAWETSPPPQTKSHVEYVETPLDALAAFVNQPIRVHTSDGVDHFGDLLSSADDRLVIRSRRRNGTADFEIMHRRIEKAEVMREVAY